MKQSHNTPNQTKLILASASQSRASILRQAGVTFDIKVSGVDEDAIKEQHHGSDEDLALDLAKAKALAVSVNADGLVLGADQIMVCDDRRYDKPSSLAVARQTLRALSGKTHYLVNGLSLCHGDNEVWSYSNRIALTMRELSDPFLDDYLAHEGESILSSVGCYRLELRGAQLFTNIEGDYFSTLGLPLLPLLNELRRLSVLAS